MNSAQIKLCHQKRAEKKCEQLKGEVFKDLFQHLNSSIAKHITQFNEKRHIAVLLSEQKNETRENFRAFENVNICQQMLQNNFER